jgi:hypothetical protein
MKDPQRHARIEDLKQKIRDATGENPVFGTMNDCPPEIEEAFLRNVLAYETAPRKPLLHALVESGVIVPAPAELRNTALSEKLWEVIHALQALRVTIDNTDHLSDRELYTVLYNETLQDEYVLGFLDQTLHIDMTESEDYEEGLRTYLKYYASEEERRSYGKDFPDLDIPRHCDPPKRRDHLIP